MALIRWAARALAVAAVMAVGFALVVLVVVPRATHAVALTVLTGSMTPSIPTGSIVLVRPVDPGTLQVGDIATYQRADDNKEFITHRIVGIDQKSTGATFEFKGDANRVADDTAVPADMIRGKVWFHVPYLGAIRDGLHGKGGLSLLAMLALAGYALSQLGGALKDRKKKNETDAEPDPEVPEPETVHVDRTLILATLTTGKLALETFPDQVARDWGAILLEENPSTYRLLIAPPPAGVEAALELLRSFDPISVEVCRSPVTLVGTGDADPVAGTLTDAEPVADHDPDVEHDRATG